MSDDAVTRTVLVVDDEPEILESLRRTLRRESYRVVTTTSPLEALAKIEAGGVDLLLADIDMPEMNGLDLVRRVRASAPDVIRILLTGDASLSSALTSINDGEVHRYLLKPWDKDELRETIRQALGRLDELRRMAAAGQRVSARQRLMRELEQAHPGIGERRLVEGVYQLDAQRLRDVVERLGESRVSALFSLLAFSADHADTRRVNEHED